MTRPPQEYDGVDRRQPTVFAQVKSGAWILAPVGAFLTLYGTGLIWTSNLSRDVLALREDIATLRKDMVSVDARFNVLNSDLAKRFDNAADRLTQGNDRDVQRDVATSAALANLDRRLALVEQKVQSIGFRIVTQQELPTPVLSGGRSK